MTQRHHDDALDARAGGSTALRPGGGQSELRPDDRRADPGPHDAPETTPASGPLLYLPFLVMMLAGFWLMGYGFDEANGVLFSLGLLLSGVAFFIPLQLLRD